MWISLGKNNKVFTIASVDPGITYPIYPHKLALYSYNRNIDHINYAFCNCFYVLLDEP